MTSILLAEDQALVRHGLKMMIEMDSDFKVTGEAENGAEALDLCRSQRFDLAILDIRMPVMNGLEASRVLRDEHPDLKILILTTFNDESYALEALKNEVNGYLLKDGDIEELLQSIHQCLEGGLILEGQVAAKVMPSLIQGKSGVEKADESLTHREKEILSLIAHGKNNQEVAEDLYLSIGTVKNQITVILDKLELRDRTQLAIYAIRHELDK